jgi:hypothetical protein
LSGDTSKNVLVKLSIPIICTATPKHNPKSLRNFNKSVLDIEMAMVSTQTDVYSMFREDVKKTLGITISNKGVREPKVEKNVRNTPNSF